MTKQEITCGDIREVINELGESAFEVAKKLEEEGCKGSRGSPSQCPVARFLRKRLGVPPDGHVRVSDTIEVYIPGGSGTKYLPTSSLSQLSLFIVAFDMGNFQNLII